MLMILVWGGGKIGTLQIDSEDIKGLFLWWLKNSKIKLYPNFQEGVKEPSHYMHANKIQLI